MTSPTEQATAKAKEILEGDWERPLLQARIAAALTTAAAAGRERLEDAARDMMHAMGKHTVSCSTCRAMLRRHADVLAPLRPESPRTEER